MLFPTAVATALGGVLLVAAALVYRALLPSPIPGIPYNKQSAKRILGDIPDVVNVQSKTGEILSFITTRCEELKSPIVQLWMRPFERPWVIVRDWKQAQDIMLRRTREFDRAPFHTSFLVSIIPNAHGAMPTNEQFRANRRLAGDTMSHAFLNQAIAPILHNDALNMSNLLREKIRLAPGRPIEVSQDMKMCIVDTTWAAAFGVYVGACETQRRHLAAHNTISLSPDPEESVRFPQQRLPDAYTAILALGRSMTLAIATPFGRYGHWVGLKIIPEYSRAMAVTNRLVDDKIVSAWDNLNRQTEAESEARTANALDLLLQREMKMAQKEGRAAQPKSPFLRDELVGFLLGSFETTSGTVCWGLKYLTKHQRVQIKLRAALVGVFEDEAKSGRQPDPEAIILANIPYLDAFVEEVLRHCCIASFLTRVALIDTEVMGYFIPKGTTLFFPGDMCQVPPREMSNTKTGTTANPADFNPDRWLVQKANGSVEFDPTAAPMLTFGQGPRACFGKRLAYLSMRILYVLLVWNFEMLPTPTSDDFSSFTTLGNVPQIVQLRLREVQHVSEAV